MISRKYSAALLLSLFFVEALLPVAPAIALSASVPATISVKAVPSILPADGQSYPAIYVSLVDATGLPALALSNVTVFLSTSAPAVGVVLNSSVVIRAGDSYAMASFETTPTSGQTMITATATGFTTGTTTLTTSVPRGYPSSITLTAVPSEVNSTSTSSRSGIVIVEFQDPAGQPAKSVSDTLVNVYSSSPKILTLNVTSFTMRAGQFLKVLSFTTGFVPGSATVTASAPEMSSGTAQVAVLGKPALSLNLYAQPDVLVTSSVGRLVIALTDSSGNPVRAPATTIIQLRSSDTTTVSAPPTARIAAGSIYTTVQLAAGSSEGNATITASASGLKSGFVSINTYKSVGVPSALKLYVGPTPVLADNGSYSAVVISLLNQTGFPVLCSSPISLTLTSSQNSSVGAFGIRQISDTPQQFPVGQDFFVWPVNFTSTYVAGTTDLTISAQNVYSDRGALSTFGPSPSRIAISHIFPVVPADGGSHPAMQISLEDASGSPAVAPAPVVVYLSSSQTGIARVDSPITIGTGDSAAVVDVVTSSVSGSANMTAYTYSLSSGYSSAATTITTVTPSPSAIGAALSLGTFSPSPFQNSTNLILQLQDSSGNPAKARVPTPVTITSSEASVYNKTIQALIPQGSSYTVVKLVPLASGSTTLTVTSPGLRTAAAQLQVLSSPLSIQVSTSSLSIVAGQASVITLTATMDGVGIPNAKVSWFASSGVIIPPTATTSSAGQALATLRPAGVGVVTISAVVSFSSGPPQHEGIVVLVSAPPSSGSQGILGTLLSFPYVLILVGAVAAAAVVVLLVIRRRRRAAEAEGAIGEEETFNYYNLPRGHGPGP